MNDNQNKEIVITAKEYFDTIKSKKETMNTEKLQKYYEIYSELANKAMITKQVIQLRKILFQMECIEKENKLFNKGINTFVYKSDILDFINNVENKVVKTIELTNYSREIPDDIVSAIAEVKDIFDDFIIVFTDYTGKEERHIKNIKKEKDPIVFGVFKDNKYKVLMDRFYYIGDWEDEYCDLTLEKMINEMSKNNKHIEQKIHMPINIEEAKEYLKNLEKSNNNSFVFENSIITSNGTALSLNGFTHNSGSKNSTFSKIKTFVRNLI